MAPGKTVTSYEDAFYRALYDNAFDNIIVRDEMGIITYITSNISRYGYKPMEWLGKTGFEFSPAADARKAKEQLKYLVENPKEEINDFYKIKTKDGDEKILEVVAKNLLDNKDVNGLVYNYRDVTDKHQTEREIIKKEKYYRTLIEKSFDLIFTCDKDGIITYLSSSVKPVLGYSKKDLLGTDAAIIFKNTSWQLWQESLQQLTKKPDSITRNEVELCSRHEGHLFMEMTGRNLLDDDAVKGFLIMFRDISASKDAQDILTNYNIRLKREVETQTEALKEKNEELETLIEDLKEAQVQLIQSEKLATLGHLTAGIAHEINNPINFVSSNIAPLKTDFSEIKLLLDKYQALHNSQNIEQDLKEIEALRKELDVAYLEEEINALLNGIEEGAKRTKEIVAGLKDFSRVDEGTIKAVNLHDGLESTLKLIKKLLTNKNIKVEKLYSETMPLVECYPGKINQVFMNILTNGMQAIERNGQITIKTWSEDEMAFVSIKDTGPGMSEEVKEKIFEPFYTNKKVGEGTGLGLSISHSIVLNHKGNIEVISEPGKGAEFIISLPLVLDQPDE